MSLTVDKSHTFKHVLFVLIILLRKIHYYLIANCTLVEEEEKI